MDETVHFYIDWEKKKYFNKNNFDCSYEGLVETVPGVNLELLRMDNYKVCKGQFIFQFFFSFCFVSLEKCITYH